MKTHLRLLSLCACAAGLAAASSDAALNSPFQSLPEETVLAFRLDNTPEVREQYVANTRIGKLLLSEEKIAEYKAYVENLVSEHEQVADFVNGLNGVGLELDDLYGMLSSHFGAAVVMQEVPGQRPMPTLLAWAEMEEATAQRAFSALVDSSAEREQIERTDQELAGAPASRIRNVGTGSSFLVAKLQNRFLFAIGFPQEYIASPDEPGVMSPELAAAYEEAELEAFGHFIQSQQSDGGNFLDAFYGDSGISSVRPSYEARLALYGDLRKISAFASPQMQQTIELLELGQFTKLAVWSGLVDREERSLIFLGAPRPRSGVAKLLEAEAFAFQPPAWVPSAVSTYSSFSFNLSNLFQIAIAIAKKANPPEMIDQQLAMVNQQLQASLQTDLDTLLNSFGKRFHALEYPLELREVDKDGAKTDVPQEQQAIVVDFANPEILDAALSMLAGISNNPQSGMALIEEQGFRGVRGGTPEGEMVIAHGQGKLVMAMGGETMANRVFSALNQAPQGEEALINDSDFRRFIEERSPKPGVAFSYAQGDKILKNLAPLFKVIGSAIRESKGEETAELVDDLVELFPSQEDLEGALGVVFTRMYVTDAGLVIEGANEYK